MKMKLAISPTVLFKIKFNQVNQKKKPISLLIRLTRRIVLREQLLAHRNKVHPRSNLEEVNQSLVGVKPDLEVDSTKDLTILMKTEEMTEMRIMMLLIDLDQEEDGNLLTCPQPLELQVATKRKKRKSPDLLPSSQLSAVKLT